MRRWYQWLGGSRCKENSIICLWKIWYTRKRIAKDDEENYMFILMIISVIISHLLWHVCNYYFIIKPKREYPMGRVVLLSGLLCAKCAQCNVYFLLDTWRYRKIFPNGIDIVKIIFCIAIILEAVLSLWYCKSKVNRKGASFPYYLNIIGCVITILLFLYFFK